MWKRCCKALACCVAALALLGGCKPDTSQDYAIITFSPAHWQVTNAEGQEVYWKMNLPEDDKKIDFAPYSAPAPLDSDYFERIEGNMEFWDDYMRGGIDIAYSKIFTTPFSDSFTVQTQLPMDVRTGFGVEFYKDGQCIQDLSVGGDYEGTATLCADGTVELHGNFKDFSCTHTYKQDGKRINLDGSGGRRIKIYPKNGSIAAEGMVGEYTVTEYEGEHYDNEVSTETRQGDN